MVAIVVAIVIILIVVVAAVVTMVVVIMIIVSSVVVVMVVASTAAVASVATLSVPVSSEPVLAKVTAGWVAVISRRRGGGRQYEGQGRCEGRKLHDLFCLVGLIRDLGSWGYLLKEFMELRSSRQFYASPSRFDTHGAPSIVPTLFRAPDKFPTFGVGSPFQFVPFPSINRSLFAHTNQRYLPVDNSDLMEGHE